MTHHDGFGEDVYEDKPPIVDSHILDLDLPVRTIKMPDIAGNWDNLPPGRTLNRDNDPHIHTNRFPPEKPRTAEQIARDHRAKISQETHHVSTVDKLPKTACYAVLINESYTYDSGYGHRGEPDMTTSNSLGLTYFDSTEALEEWVLDATKQRKTFSVIHMKPVVTEVKAVFSIKD